MEAPGFLELVWPEIRKNVFEVSTSSDQKRQLETLKRLLEPFLVPFLKWLPQETF